MIFFTDRYYYNPKTTTANNRQIDNNMNLETAINSIYATVTITSWALVKD